jgi:cytidylate kinase
MILLVNGAFGIGKTTVARELVARIPRSILYDPELAGIVMQRVLRVDDFQDLKIWRRFTITALRLTRLLWPNVIVPMAFSNVDYLREIQSGVARFESRSYHVCLVAPVTVVYDRLSTRKLQPRDAAWQFRRAAECCKAHQQPAFATHINAADRSVSEIADEILRIATEEGG